MTERRGPGDGSLSQRKDGRWVARVDLGRDDLGRRVRVSLYAATKSEGREKLRAALREKASGRLVARPSGAPKTLGGWLDQWLEVVRRTREPKTHENYESLVRIHLKPGLGRVRLERLTPAAVERFLVAKLDSGLAASSVKKIQAALAAALSSAMKKELVSRNAADSRSLTLPPAQARTSRIMSLEEAKRFLDRIQGDRLHALYLLALVLGQRQSEMLGLRWQDIDFEGGRLRITYKLIRLRGGWQLRRPKTKGSRHTLPLLAPVASALKEHRIRQQWERDIAGSAWQQMEGDAGPVDLVFTGRNGAPLYGTHVTDAFQALLAEAGLPSMRFQDLRHSAASVMLALGIPLKTVSEVLGHSTIRLTSDTYGHLTEEVLRDQLGGLSDAWSAPSTAPGRLRERA